MIEHIKRIVGEYLSQFVRPKYGTITSYDPNTYRVKVMLQPEQIETGWVQLSAPFVGKGFGAVFGPSIGDLVRIDFLDGSAQAAVVGGRFFNDGAQPPAVQSGAAILTDVSGSTITLDGKGGIQIQTNGGTGTITLSAEKQIKISAPDVQIQGINFSTHVHGGVTPGGANTTSPTGAP